MNPHQTLTDAATDATLTTFALRLRHDIGTPGCARGLRHLLAECDRDIAQETADELGIPLPDCAREGWAA